MLMAKKKLLVKKPKTESVPDFKDSAEWDGAYFCRCKDHAFQYYRLEKKASDFKRYTLDWVKTSDEWKDKYDILNKAPESRFNSTLGCLCNLIKQGLPDVHLKYNEYWESLPGTMGTPKPHSEYINKWLNEILDIAQNIQEEQHEIAKVEGKKYVPSIQERIREQCSMMVEDFEQALDDFSMGTIKDFKAINPIKRLRQLQCKQPHARNITGFYEKAVKDYNELLNPPDTSKMSEQEKDWAKQLKEAYLNYDKKQVKKLYDFMVAIISACDAIIAESKANRKPRKISRKSPEKLTEKLKYKISDEKFAISSVQPYKIIGATCLVVFNSKNRKLGIYYTSMEDPTGTSREGSGLALKGQTLQRFKEKESVWWTLRKPMEQLQEVKNLNTRKKFENWIEKLTTTPTIMNGRINPETILIGVY
jgi:hypothetical protein|tara:strand:+ start:1197 stop:2456 length:1260 start_codon:yes stop_codon:yes gene_type:complete